MWAERLADQEHHVKAGHARAAFSSASAVGGHARPAVCRHVMPSTGHLNGVPASIRADLG